MYTFTYCIYLYTYVGKDNYVPRPIALYCDGEQIGAMDPVVYASKLSQQRLQNLALPL